MVGVAGFAPAACRISAGCTSICAPHHHWSGRQVLPLLPPRSERGRLLLTYALEKMDTLTGFAPAYTGLQPVTSASRSQRVNWGDRLDLHQLTERSQRPAYLLRLRPHDSVPVPCLNSAGHFSTGTPTRRSCRLHPTRAIACLACTVSAPRRALLGSGLHPRMDVRSAIPSPACRLHTYNRLDTRRRCDAGPLQRWPQARTANTAPHRKRHDQIVHNSQTLVHTQLACRLETSLFLRGLEPRTYRLRGGALAC
jgi:hypothetical protein